MGESDVPRSMDALLIAAASGMKARLESLDMLANNIANSGTSGFKADHEFYSLVQDQLPLVERNWTDFSQGVLTPTANPLDLALSGPGFFALNSPAGVVYTRNGQFQVGTSNQLQTAEGFTLRNTRDNGRPIAVDPALPVSIAKTGVVAQGGQEIAQIEIAGLGADANSGSLAKQGNSYFRLAAPGILPPAPTTEVMQGTLEQSNVPAADSAVRLVNVMRQFEMLQRAVTLSADMDKQAISEVAKVS